MTAESSYVVIDTNVVIYLLIGSPLSKRFEPYLLRKTPVLSFQSVRELRLIAHRRGWGERRLQDLEGFFLRAVIANANDLITRRWARLMYDQTIAGSRIEPSDAWIAATALVYDCPLLTNDRKDFDRIAGLTVQPA